VRFSDPEGNPRSRDTVPVARGPAARFLLPDLVAMTVPLFVASAPGQFLELTGSLRSAPPPRSPT